MPKKNKKNQEQESLDICDCCGTIVDTNGNIIREGKEPKYKKLQEESDLILLKEYTSPLTPSFNEMIFYIFMIVLYYSGYARWFFWFILIIFILSFIYYLLKESMYEIIKKELKRRGIL